MECCGKNRTTRYCPDCGEAMEEDYPLDSLLRHVQARLEVIANDIQRGVNAKADGKAHGWTEESIARAKKRRVKWTLWRDALVEAIKKSKRKS